MRSHSQIPAIADILRIDIKYYHPLGKGRDEGPLGRPVFLESAPVVSINTSSPTFVAETRTTASHTSS